MATGLERPTQSIELNGVFISDDADRPLALAELFCALFGDEQAQFLDHVALLTQGWHEPACFQWRSMEDHITSNARSLLREMLDNTEKSPTGAAP